MHTGTTACAAAVISRQRVATLHGSWARIRSRHASRSAPWCCWRSTPSSTCVTRCAASARRLALRLLPRPFLPTHVHMQCMFLHHGLLPTISSCACATWSCVPPASSGTRQHASDGTRVGFAPKWGFGVTSGSNSSSVGPSLVGPGTAGWVEEEVAGCVAPVSSCRGAQWRNATNHCADPPCERFFFQVSACGQQALLISCAYLTLFILAHTGDRSGHAHVPRRVRDRATRVLRVRRVCTG